MPTTGTDTLQTYSVSGLNGLLSLRKQWDELFADCINPVFYNDWRWHHAIQKHLIATPIQYLVVTEADMPVAIVPLQQILRRKGKLPIRYLSLPYHVALDLADIVLRQGYAQKAVWDEIIRFLRKQAPCSWEALELTRFTERSGLRQLLKSASWPLEPLKQSAYVTTDAGDLSQNLSKKQVKNVRRHARNGAEQFGENRFETVTEPAKISDAYATFLEVEAAGWKGAEGTNTAIKFRADAKAFYLEALQSFAETGDANLNLLYFGAQPAAAQMGLHTGEKLCLLKIGYDEQFRDVGPGGVILLNCLDQSSGNGIRELSLVTSPPWAERWHFTNENTYSYTSFNTTLYARLLVYIRNLLQMRTKPEPAASTPDTISAVSPSDETQS